MTEGVFIDPKGHIMTLRASSPYEFAVLVTRKLGQGWRRCAESPPVAPTFAVEELAYAPAHASTVTVNPGNGFVGSAAEVAAEVAKQVRAANLRQTAAPAPIADDAPAPGLIGTTTPEEREAAFLAAISAPPDEDE